MLSKPRRNKLPSITRAPAYLALELARDPRASTERRMAVARGLIRQGLYVAESVAILDQLRRKPIGRA